jgi:hypothetical protein
MRRACSNAVLAAEAEIAGEIGANRVRIEHHRIEQRRQRRCQRRLAGAGKSHDQDFALHVPGSVLAVCFHHFFGEDK